MPKMACCGNDYIHKADCPEGQKPGEFRLPPAQAPWDSWDALDTAFAAIAAETLHARGRYPAFNSGHEGYAVLLEEVEELWEVVRNHHAGVDDDQGYRLRLRAEATQVAAMAVRIILELT